MYVAIQEDRICYRSCIREKVESHIAEHGGVLCVLLYDEAAEDAEDFSEEIENELENAIL